MQKRQLSEKEKIAWLRLIRSENVGAATFENLMRFYEKPSDALKDLPNWAKRGGTKRTITVCSEDAAVREMEEIQSLGAELLCSCDEAYPKLLKAIKNAPPVLTVLGHTSLFKVPSVAFVGARNASLNGKNLTRQLAFECVENGVAVVSGMALGIDGAAHEGALSSTNSEAGTIAVLGCGVDVVYPSEHQNLYSQIKERGVIVSDFPVGTRPNAMHFPRRNRIISGLSLGTLVVEAKENSGSMITASYAQDQKRVLMAVPGSPMDDRSVVPNTLLKDGAVLVRRTADILKAIENKWDAADNFFLHENKQDMDYYRLPASDDVDLARPIVLSSLSANPVSEEELIRELSLPNAIVSVILLELELAGRIQRHSLGRVSLVYDGLSGVSASQTNESEWMED